MIRMRRSAVTYAQPAAAGWSLFHHSAAGSPHPLARCPRPLSVLERACGSASRWHDAAPMRPLPRQPQSGLSLTGVGLGLIKRGSYSYGDLHLFGLDRPVFRKRDSQMNAPPKNCESCGISFPPQCRIRCDGTDAENVADFGQVADTGPDNGGPAILADPDGRAAGSPQHLVRQNTGGPRSCREG